MTVDLDTSDSRLTQASLLERARSKNPQAWSDLVDLYGPLIAHWCRQCGMDSHSTADCTQDVFTAVARSLDQYQPRGRGGSFRAWLWTVTSNKIKDRFRIDARNVSADGGSTAYRNLNTVADQNSVPDDEPTESSQISDLVARGCLQIRDEFAEKTWSIFERAVIDDIATAQVAEEFGVTAATVRQSRSRILRRLRQHLGDAE